MTSKANSAKQSAPWPPHLVVVTTCWVVSLAVMLLTVFAMRYATGLARIVPIGALESLDVCNSHLTVESDRERFCRELTPIVDKLNSSEAKVLAILEWVMNQIPKVENRYARSSWRMVEIGRSGGGLICGGMAQLFKDALLTQGIPARVVSFQRNLFDLYDTHASVEAYVDSKWRLYDPTFHLSLKAEGKRVGVFTARDWFIKGIGPRVELEFLGEVKYPARIDNYPIRYEAFFDNVYVNARRDIGVLGDIPFVGGWLSRELLYPIIDPGLSTMAQDFYRVLFYTTLVVIPAINLSLLLAMGYLWRKAHRCCP